MNSNRKYVTNDAILIFNSRFSKKIDQNNGAIVNV